jgi:hypothetical protein
MNLTRSPRTAQHPLAYRHPGRVDWSEKIDAADFEEFAGEANDRTCTRIGPIKASRRPTQ